MRRLTSLACVASLVVASAPAVAARQLDAVAIGDSVMLGAKSHLQELGIDVVDAEVSRQASRGPGLVRDFGDQLPRHVVVHLGSNGTFALETCRELVRAVGSRRIVYLITVKVPRPWENVNNRTLRQCDGRFPSNRVVILDWNALASDNPNYLYADGVHLRPDGARAFARMIDRAIAADPQPGPSLARARG